MKIRTFIKYLTIIFSFVLSLILISHFTYNALFYPNSSNEIKVKTTKDGVKYSEDGYIIDYVGDSNELVIPTQIKNVKITKISSQFLYEKSIDRLEMPSTIEYIAEDTFKFSKIKDFYYNGRIEDWITKINHGCEGGYYGGYYNPIGHSENFYIKNEHGEYYLVKDYIIIPSTVKEITPFSLAIRLDLYLDKALEKIDRYAFGNVWGSQPFKNVYYNGSVEDWCRIEGSRVISVENFYILNQNKYELLTRVVIHNTELIDHFEGVQCIKDIIFEFQDGITDISSPFSSNDNITEIIIPNSVTHVSDINCSNLKKVYLPSHLEEFEHEFTNNGDFEIEFVYI